MSDQKIILLVDEDAKYRQNLSSRLSMNGYKVYQATSGFHSLNLIEENIFDLILLKNSMGQMGGMETLILIRSSKKNPSIPAILVKEEEELTGSDELGDDLKGLLNGIYNTASSFQELLEKINTALNLKSV